MDQIYLLAASRQEDRILYSHISAAYYGGHFIFKESSVAGGTVGHAHASEFVFSRNLKLSVAGTGSQDQCSRLI